MLSKESDEFKPRRSLQTFPHQFLAQLMNLSLLHSLTTFTPKSVCGSLMRGMASKIFATDIESNKSITENLCEKIQMAKLASLVINSTLLV